MSMIIDGTNGLTFNNATTQNSGGKVLQVVQGTSTTSTSASTSTFVSVGLSASITPLFSTSKILAIAVGGTIYTNAGGNQARMTIYRGSTNLGDSSRGMSQHTAGTTYVQTGLSIGYLDSPATTSATTYAVYMASGAGTVNYTVDSSVGSIILMEIAA
jgi:hypothetical protein